ncbi:hypothetical protein NKOR_02390 [Candidatus Nitrosopumilus koreensis AR1]|uniref:Uncharacterized protein n=1 Tax=Candidatus Nitrosopumilus koreensis AR1 TaxID=1229908 RepID=K0B7E7_9ARCH|nr:MULTISPECIES: hypothetical protein [Nitrosopumilus]AFS80376.1 hypothetical protein NKOR_02390 [Candidatus Nitrosopumilus koreensis AR1]
MANGLKVELDVDVKKIRELIDYAKKSVENEDDELIKNESYKIILKLLLDRYLSSESIPQGAPKIGSNLTKKQNELANLCSITISELYDVFKFQDSSVNLVAAIQGSDSFKHLVGTQCYLAALEVVYEKDWVSSNDVTECMRSMGVKDLSNLATNLKKHSDIFRISGTRGHNKYKLTSGMGRKSAFDFIHKLGKGESLHEN